MDNPPIKKAFVKPAPAKVAAPSMKKAVMDNPPKTVMHPPPMKIAAKTAVTEGPKLVLARESDDEEESDMFASVSFTRLPISVANTES